MCQVDFALWIRNSNPTLNLPIDVIQIIYEECAKLRQIYTWVYLVILYCKTVR